jgi:hypothetical protein
VISFVRVIPPYRPGVRCANEVHVRICHFPFISGIFTCFWYDIVPIMHQLRYDIVPRTELLSLLFP